MFKSTLKPISKIFIAVFITMGIISCSETIQQNPINAPETSLEMQPINASSSIDNRAVSINDEIKQVFGPGFLVGSTDIAMGVNAVGRTIGSSGGFGFGGSISSIVGNVGGFGTFGGFASFASALGGGIGTFTPPVGGSGSFASPIGGIGTFTPPVGGIGIIAPPVGGVGTFLPPIDGSGTFTPPALRPGTLAPPTTGGLGALVPESSLNKSNQTILAAAGISLLESNLSESNTLLSNNDNTVIFVNVDSATSDINLLAVTDTVTQCLGGGTKTKSVNDVDPVGPSTGDTNLTTFVDCARNSAATSVVNGSRGFSVESMVGVPFIDTAWSSETTMFRNNITRTNAVNGNQSVSNGSTTNNINVDAISISQSSNGSGNRSRINGTTGVNRLSEFLFTSNFSINKTVQTFSIDLNFGRQTTAPEITSSRFITPTPISGSIGTSPTSGQLVVTKGVNNVNIRIDTLTAQADGTVLLESDTNADGSPETTEILANWMSAFLVVFQP